MNIIDNPAERSTMNESITPEIKQITGWTPFRTQKLVTGLRVATIPIHGIVYEPEHPKWSLPGVIHRVVNEVTVQILLDGLTAPADFLKEQIRFIHTSASEAMQEAKAEFPIDSHIRFGNSLGNKTVDTFAKVQMISYAGRPPESPHREHIIILAIGNGKHYVLTYGQTPISRASRHKGKQKNRKRRR